MHVVGVIAEYNPFHKGHLYQINEIRRMYDDCIVVVVMSSSFMQRGEVSIINRWNKTKIALDYGADLVLELPFCYASQASDVFASGALKILNYVGIDTLVFGSECNDIDILYSLANTQINNEKYKDIVKEYLDKGFNYPTSLSRALEDITGIKIYKPNDLLALSYIKEIISNKYNITPISIKRTSDYHNSDINNDIISASSIRKLINDNYNVDRYVPYKIDNYLEKIDIDKYFSLLKYQIINNIDRLDMFQTVDEGIEKRIVKYIYEVNDIEYLILKVKSKRYTYNKIRRMFTHILCNFTKEEARRVCIDYIRVLGFNDVGRKYLNKVKKEVDIPITSKYITNKSLCFDIEKRVSMIYTLMLCSDSAKKFMEDEVRNRPIIK